MKNKMRCLNQVFQNPTYPYRHSKQTCMPVQGLIEENQADKPTMEVLLESDHDFELLLNNIPAVVFKGYIDGTVDFFDEKIEEMTG